MRASTVKVEIGRAKAGRYDLDGAQRAVKSRVEFTSDLIIRPASAAPKLTSAMIPPTDVAAQHRGAATSFSRPGGREVFGVESESAAAAKPRANNGEVFAVARRFARVFSSSPTSLRFSQ